MAVSGEDGGGGAVRAEVDAPVLFGGMTFAHGGVLHADGDGVGRLPGG
ncbi:hypothetical protein AB0D14_31880 [Streptomyces sp. NPDC048484]